MISEIDYHFQSNMALSGLFPLSENDNRFRSAKVEVTQCTMMIN